MTKSTHHDRSLTLAGLLAVALVLHPGNSLAVAQDASAREANRTPEGNWFVQWDDYPEKGQSLQGAIALGKVEEVWKLTGQRFGESYKHDFWGRQANVLPTGNIEFHLGHLGISRLQQIGPDEIKGRWAYNDRGGAEVWRRASPEIQRVVFDVGSEPESEVAFVAGRPDAVGRVERTKDSLGSARDVSGNRPRFEIHVFGKNLWGHRVLQLRGATGLACESDGYLRRDGSRHSWVWDVNRVIGGYVTVRVNRGWTPGRKTLVFDGIEIPFDLIVDGHPAAEEARGPRKPDPERQQQRPGGDDDPDLGSICGIKWSDENGNGRKEIPPETPLAGWTIYLDMDGNGSRDNDEPQAVTDVNGRFSFKDLKAGKYVVREVLQPGWRQTFPDDGHHLADLPEGGKIGDLDFGNQELAQVSGVKYNDLNGNGKRDHVNGQLEPGLPGWTIFVDYNQNTSVDKGERSDVTDENGHYTITDVLPGRLRRVSEDPTNEQNALWTFCNPAGGFRDVDLAAGEQKVNVNFGNWRPARVNGRVYEDKNGNKKRDSGEGGVHGAVVWADAPDGQGIYNGKHDVGEPFGMSRAGGAYSLRVPAGEHKICVDVGENWTTTEGAGGHEVKLAEGEVTEKDFGAKGSATIKGVKYNDLNGNGKREQGEPPVERWRIYLDVNGNGKYEWKEGGKGEPGTLTNAAGRYSFQVEPGTYTVAETWEGGWQNSTPMQVKVTVAAGKTATVDFGNFRFVTIAGTVFQDRDGDGVQDENEPGIPGRTVVLDENGNGVRDGDEKSTTTDENGKYRFGRILAGDYKVVLEPSEKWKDTSPAGGGYTPRLAPGDRFENADFGCQGSATIKGVKYNDLNGNGKREQGEPPVERWRIYLDVNGNGKYEWKEGGKGEPGILTNAAGRYSFQVEPGTYTVAETWEGGWQNSTPMQVKVTVAAGKTATVDFGNFRFVTIAGTVFQDRDGDGVQDENEPGIPGRTVVLDENGNGVRDGDEKSTTTDENGKYRFGRILAGDYRVVLEPSAKWKDTSPAEGGYRPTLAPGDRFEDADFGCQGIVPLKDLDPKEDPDPDDGAEKEPKRERWVRYSVVERSDHVFYEKGEFREQELPNGQIRVEFHKKRYEIDIFNSWLPEGNSRSPKGAYSAWKYSRAKPTTLYEEKARSADGLASVNEIRSLAGKFKARSYDKAMMERLMTQAVRRLVPRPLEESARRGP